ncbi:MAG: response regulator [Pseudorhodoplanes sp.]|nr:response regulator [Pseudorhodoplanes sp.]
MADGNLVHVIDDDDAVRSSLEFLLRTANIDVRTYDSATAFLRNLKAGERGCIVTDVRMPEMSGIELLRRLNDMSIDMPVIVITGHGDVSLAVEAMKAGAVDFLEKPFEDDRVLAAIGSALERNREEGARAVERARIREKMAQLSQREREVLEGLVAGAPNKMIAFDLGISARTVEVYRANVMTKMEAKSLSELVRMAIIASGT